MGYSPNETFLKDALAPSSPPFWRAAVLEKKKTNALGERESEGRPRERERGRREKGVCKLGLSFSFPR